MPFSLRCNDAKTHLTIENDMCWISAVMPILEVGPLRCKTGHHTKMAQWFQQVVKPVKFGKRVVKMLSCLGAGDKIILCL